jgi:hypothetical protein
MPKKQTTPIGYYTLYALITQRIPVLGSPRTRMFYMNLLKDSGLEPAGTTDNGADYYSLNEIESIAKERARDGVGPRNDQHHGQAGPDIIELKKTKLKNEIEIQKLQIEQLKFRLIDYDEGLQYMIKFKSAVSAILRKIFLSQIPVEVTGLDPAKAREKGEGYYNQVMRELTKSVEEWEDTYKKDEDSKATKKSNSGE